MKNEPLAAPSFARRASHAFEVRPSSSSIMATIELSTEIEAPPQRCFDLSRSIDLHVQSTASTGETAVAGVTSGLIGLGEEVTWRAKHFGIWQHLTSKIVALDSPRYFRDQMTKGAFKRFVHDHYFLPRGEQTVMKDVLVFEAPLGPFGRVADRVILTGYLKRFLLERNALIKRTAETQAWRDFVE
ncbi:MAG: SRPBCC family protein [Polyangiales bacterium]